MLFFTSNFSLRKPSNNCVYIKKNTLRSFVVFSQYNHLIVIYSLFRLELVNVQHFGILSVNSYSNKSLYFAYVLFSVLIYHLNVNFNYFLSYYIGLESSSFNSGALSLYLWLGFRFVNFRTNYYCTIDITSNSAYVMSSDYFFSKNYYRRYFIVLINH